ncbi:MAG: hypothetical protein IJ026_05540 [Candidatus Methanomethylophilaceae archaeon]|nr:hypothetical protein [Candidatus Methanomethylophilaceae archaeon]
MTFRLDKRTTTVVAVAIALILVMALVAAAFTEMRAPKNKGKDRNDGGGAGSGDRPVGDPVYLYDVPDPVSGAEVHVTGPSDEVFTGMVHIAIDPVMKFNQRTSIV